MIQKDPTKKAERNDKFKLETIKQYYINFKQLFNYVKEMRFHWSIK